MPRILVVEDNDDNRDVLSRRLQRSGFDVLFAPDGVAAVFMAQSEKPDLILMDMNMPEMDGWEATQKIRADPAISSVPVIALTGYAMTGDRERALEAGCSDYHTKPIEYSKLLLQIQTILDKQTGSSS